MKMKWDNYYKVLSTGLGRESELNEQNYGNLIIYNDCKMQFKFLVINLDYIQPIYI